MLTDVVSASLLGVWLFSVVLQLSSYSVPPFLYPAATAVSPVCFFVAEANVQELYNLTGVESGSANAASTSRKAAR